MKELLIVDGYNVIHAWPELAALMNEDPEHARDRLVDIMADYAAFNSNKVIVVFDAHHVKGGLGSSDFRNGVEVIYSQEGETADSVIERLVAATGLSRVVVATSDWTQQSFIFGKGATRMSARELVAEVEHCREQEKESKEMHVNHGDHNLGSRIKNDIKEVLEKIRRQK